MPPVEADKEGVGEGDFEGKGVDDPVGEDSAEAV